MMHPPSLKPITLRNLPPSVARAVKARAEADGLSLNRAVIRLLEDGLRAVPRKPEPIGRRLDKYIGVMSAEEADEFMRWLAEERKVDPRDWE